MSNRDDDEEIYDDFDDTRPMPSPRTGEIKWPPTDDDATPIEIDTREMALKAEVSQSVKVISPEAAAAIRFDYEPTVMEDDRFNFIGEVNADGVIEIPERFQKPGGLVPGAQIIVSVSLRKSKDQEK